MPANTSIIPIKAIRDGDQSTGDVVALGEFEAGDKLDTSYFSVDFTEVSLSGNTTFDTSTMFVDGTNNRVGIGTTSPVGLLSLESNNPNIRFDDSDTSNNGEITLDNTALRIEADEDNAVASSLITFRVDGSEAMRINSDSEVLVGTTSSGAKLRVSQGSSTSAALIEGSGYQTYFGYGGNLDNYISSGASGNPAIFRVGSTEVARINSSGDLLIGTTSSAAALRVDADSNTTNNRALHLQITDNVCDQTMYGAYIDYNVSGSDATTTNQTHVGLRIDTDSSATGGTTTNDHRVYSIWNTLDVTGDSDLVYGVYNAISSTLSTADTTTNLYGQYNLIQGDNTAGTITNEYGIYIGAYTEGTVDNLRGTSILTYVQNGATVTTAYGVNSEVQLDATGTATSIYGVRSSIDDNGGTSTNQFLYYGDYQGTPGGSGYGLYITGEDKNYISNSVGIGTVPSYDLHVSGAIYATGDITAYSDIALKENVETIQNPIDLVNGMRGVTFTRKDTGKEGVGVIAQEMREVLPQVVTEENGHIGVAYGNIVGVLIEAVKELNAKVKQLEETIINKS